ncbi:MAG: CCA tRNA nucleotidyltransferase [Rhodospirillales bacterium]
MNETDLYTLEVHGLAPTGQLGPEPWLSDPDTIAVLDAIEAGGHPARFVGGCVRDAIAHRPVSDIDIATPERPEQVMEFLDSRGIKVVPTGIRHGTVTAVSGRHAFQITTLRKDVETDGRHATVAFTDDWIADARRRDFTFNALSATRNGEVYDPFEGIPDLAHGYVRFIGRPSDRIAEDYLRVLRFFRFRATHGREPTNPDALVACRLAADHLKSLSGERVRDEMLKILTAPNSAEILLMMRGEKVLQEVLPEAADLGRLRAVEWLETKAIKVVGVGPDRMRRLAATLEPSSAETSSAAIAHRWRLSNRETSRLATMAIPLGIDPDSPLDERRAALHDSGVEAFRDRVLLMWAGEVANEPRVPATRTAAWIETLELASDWTSPVFPLTGHDVMRLGIERGPAIGEALRAVEDWWAAGGFNASRDDCLEELRRRYAA